MEGAYGWGLWGQRTPVFKLANRWLMVKRLSGACLILRYSENGLFFVVSGACLI